jgi:L,D-transpeptidase ErfK/SrfK
MEDRELVVSKRSIFWEKLSGMYKVRHASVLTYFRRNQRSVRMTGLLLIVLVTFILFFVIVLYVLPFIQEHSFIIGSTIRSEKNQSDSTLLVNQERNLEKEIINLEKKLTKKTPQAAYLVVNTSKNKFFLYKNRELIGKGKCSTGSYILLSNGDEQQWIFKTPRGAFQIKGKTVEPVWIKPDWAFVEEGLPIPPVAHPSRYEYGVLGDYALSLGHGYMIHGTIYQRFLGLPVTHGCIRLNDEDLNLVYHRLSVGSKVFIY